MPLSPSSIKATGILRYCKIDTKNIERGTADKIIKNADCPAIAKILS
jgi:hypothetical protein